MLPKTACNHTLRRLTLPLIVFMTVSLQSFVAWGDICLEVDESQDSLSQSDRSGALVLLRRAFADEGETVVSDGCETTYTVFHVQLGRAVTVVLQWPEGEIDMQAASIEELPDVYSQLVRRALYGDSVTTSTTTRSNVTSDQDLPQRVQADNVVYFRLGLGGLYADSMATGPAFAFGDRYELDNIAIDAAMNMLILTDDGPDDGFNGTGRLGILYFFDGMQDSTAYLGGGLTYGVTAICIDEGECYSDSGLGADIFTGYEFLRSSTIRFFIEFAVSLPFYDTDYAPELSSAPSTHDSFYIPGANLSLGLGFGRIGGSGFRFF